MLKLRLKIALLLMLMGSAAFTGAEALRSLRTAPGTGVPEELYRQFARNAETAVAGDGHRAQGPAQGGPGHDPGGPAREEYAGAAAAAGGPGIITE